MNSEQFALKCAEYALDKKAFNLKLFRVKELSSLTDFILIATGRSDRQVQAIAEGVRIGMKQGHTAEPMAIEGMTEGRWVLLDYGDVMVHAFQEPVREFYDLEGLWCDATEIDLSGLEAEERVAAES